MLRSAAGLLLATVFLAAILIAAPAPLLAQSGDKGTAPGASKAAADSARVEKRAKPKKSSPRPGWSDRNYFDPEAVVGGLEGAREQALGERGLPAVRYSRVEGTVLGLGTGPLDLGSKDPARARLVGQLGYAFALDEWRYRAGVEVRPAPARRLKVGVSYQRNTVTSDAWKVSDLENTLGALLFGQDFFDYYEVQGASAYAVWRPAGQLRLSAGYRAEEYRSLRNETDWALFGGGRGFRVNPLVAEGQMHSVVGAAEGERAAFGAGRAAWRLEGELGGNGLGGDFSFSRVVADARLATPVTALTELRLHGRVGATAGGAPRQKQFTLGGLGTARGYRQNAFPATRMALVQAEYAFHDLDIEPLGNGLSLFGLFDAAYAGGEGGARYFGPRVLEPRAEGRWLTSAGLGLGFAGREAGGLRLELAFPLREDLAGGPTFLLRLNPWR